MAKIEALAAKTKEANELRNQAIISTDKLMGSEICHIFLEMTKAHWKEGCLGDYVLNDCYGTSEKTIDNPSGTPILRMGNIQRGRLVTSELKYLKSLIRTGKKEYLNQVTYWLIEQIVQNLLGNVRFSSLKANMVLRLI